MTKQVLILSPHCDDVSLSLGASLTAGLFGTAVRVVVVFSQSCYTRFERCTAPVRCTTALRMLEERRASRYAGYKVTFLRFPEPFVRAGYKTLDDIFDETRRPEQEACWTEVHDSLLHIMREHYGPILAPLGCGGHIDHRIVTTCFREFAWQLPDVIPVFYEDLPYAAWWSSMWIRALVPSEWRGIPIGPVALRRGSIEDKMRLLAIYESQIDDEYVACVKAHWDCRAHAELLWMPQTLVAETFPEACT